MTESVSYRNKDITSKDKADIEGLRDAIESLARKEEIMWKQRAKALWLAAGDRNTGFFHAKATERRHQNEIKRINDELGQEDKHVRIFDTMWRDLIKW
ncbi:UNVERIFIED_CONTAM: hypothetical protein Sradi_1715300 [Sesamum radiatum]|uniref:Uncharacterized protein n=1 Tax=Sesamum radiatum TaxID=300843 RepID=A0AAW2TTM5_SESRA